MDVYVACFSEVINYTFEAFFFFCSCTAFNSSEFLFNVSLFDPFYVRFLQMSSDPCLSDPILE